MKRTGSAVDANPVLRVAEGSKVALEGSDLATKGELTRIPIPYGRLESTSSLMDAYWRFEIKERYHAASSCRFVKTVSPSVAHRGGRGFDELHETFAKATVRIRRLFGVRYSRRSVLLQSEEPRSTLALAPTCPRYGSRPASPVSGSDHR